MQKNFAQIRVHKRRSIHETAKVAVQLAGLIDISARFQLNRDTFSFCITSYSATWIAARAV